MVTTIREFITPNFPTLDPVEQYYAMTKAIAEYARQYADYERHLEREVGPYNPELIVGIQESYGKICNSAYELVRKEAQKGW